MRNKGACTHVLCTSPALTAKSFIIKTDEESSCCVQLSVGIYLKGVQIPQLPILQPSRTDMPKRKIQHHFRINVQLHVYYVLNKYDYGDAIPNIYATHKHNDFSHAIHQVIYRVQTIRCSTRAAFQNSSRTASFKINVF